VAKTSAPALTLLELTALQNGDKRMSVANFSNIPLRAPMLYERHNG
jgi:hypothetical protein